VGRDPGSRDSIADTQGLVCIARNVIILNPGLLSQLAA
jgi:hypothetical protein